MSDEFVMVAGSPEDREPDGRYFDDRAPDVSLRVEVEVEVVVKDDRRGDDERVNSACVFLFTAGVLAVVAALARGGQRA